VTLVAGLASTIFMPIEAALLERLGWRTALTVLAVVLGLITIPIHALLLRQARPTRPPPPPTRRRRACRWGQAARTAVLLGALDRVPVSNFATAAVTTHLIPFLVDRGYAPATAAAVIGWTGAMQLAGACCSCRSPRGWARGWMVAAVFVAQALGIAQLPLRARRTLVPFISCRARPTAWPPWPAHLPGRDLRRAQLRCDLRAVALGANGARAVGPVGASLLLLGLGSYPAVFWALAASRSPPPAPCCSRTGARAPTTDYAGRILAVVREWPPRPGDGVRGAAVTAPATPRVGSEPAPAWHVRRTDGVGCTGPNTRSSRASRSSV